MIKDLKSEVINGVEFYFLDAGGAIVVTAFGTYSGRGDYVGTFNSKDEAMRNLKAATIKKTGKNSFQINNLKSIDEKQFQDY
tara:strand:- start:51 stop:296 length:246 start_codon:yes stop_codon:yes gene_type:complete